MEKRININIVWFCKISLFIIYFWFGLLKVLNLSPAEELVHALFTMTLAWLVPFNVFYLLFALFECFLGILFLVKKAEKYAFYLMLIHIFTTALPLIILPEYAWSGFMVLTLAGQYIVKNLLILAAGFVITFSRDL